VRLTLLEQEEKGVKHGHGTDRKQHAAAAAAAAAAAGGRSGDNDRPSSPSQGGSPKYAAATVTTIAAAAMASEEEELRARRALLPYVDVPAVYHSNQAEADDSATVATSAVAAAAAAANIDRDQVRTPKLNKRSKKGRGDRDTPDIEPELATITFVVPPATAFAGGDELGEQGVLAALRALEIDLAMNGQQFVFTGMTIKFEKDTGKRKLDKQKRVK